jgi:ElaB/YqjD/DUF883 family membrane-anchored ribosome-binding protein
MEDISFLIIDKLKGLTYYNSASLINLYPRDPDFEGYRETRLLQGFTNLIDQNLLAPHPITGGTGADKNYVLTDKGEKAYSKEKQLREQKAQDAVLQVRLTESVISVNGSVVQTNQSVQATNDFVTTNGVRQTKLGRASIIVATLAVIVAAAPFISSLLKRDNTLELLIQNRATNEVIRDQTLQITKILKQQNEIDSILAHIALQKQAGK